MSLKKTLSAAFYKHYKTLSAKGLSFAVAPTVIGGTPAKQENTLTFYVLDEYSRANTLLLENQVNDNGLSSAVGAVMGDGVSEQSAMIFLKHRRAKTAVSPRLKRLIDACLENPNITIRLVPVTILWGRAPDKEDSLFKLLIADEWRVPSMGKQLFNIGVMGRDTFVQFYDAKDLHHLIKDAKADLDKAGEMVSTEAIAQKIQARLSRYLLKQRTSILGPDLSDRRNIADGILRASTVQNAIMEKSAQTGKPIEIIKKEAKDYINEIASDYSYSIVRVFERFLTWLWTQLYDGVEVRHFDRIRQLAPDHQIIYVPCHRSHMDYLLLSYVIHTRGLRMPHVAAGANLNIPILGEILRSGGAFFLRRSFRDNPLYGTVFKEYLHSLMIRNAPIEYFIEGGRSRTGRLLAPKLGMLAMTVQSHLRQPAKPVVFIPTYISYERIMEGATYVGELNGKPKETENLLSLIKTARKIERIFGTVHLSFGEPLHLNSFIDKFNIDTTKTINDQEEAVSRLVQNLGIKIMQNINKTAVVNPVSLIALVLLSSPKFALDKQHCLIQLQLYQQIATALPYDKDTAITDMAADKMIEYAKNLRLIERIPHVLGDVVQVAEKQAAMLSYFRNNILHVFIIPSLLAALVQRNGRIYIQDLYNIGSMLYPFLQAELFLPFPQKSIENTLEQFLQVLIDTHIVIKLDNGMVSSPDANSMDYQKLVVLASPAQQSLERYVMAVTLIAEQGSGRMNETQAVDLSHLVGQRLSVLYGDDLPDLFDKAVFKGFIHALIRTGFIVSDDKQILHFDERISKIAHYARLVLSPDMLSLIQHATQLSQEELTAIHQSKGLSLIR